MKARGKGKAAANGATGEELSPKEHAKLVELFENRNLIKRELDQVKAERDVLKADTESLRKRHDELERQLAGLEQMLADPDKGQTAIVYYRLRAVWTTCRQQLRALADELRGRYEKAQRETVEKDFEASRSKQLHDLSERFEKLERERRSLRNTLADLQQEIAKHQKRWQRGKRNTLQRRIDELTAQFNPLETQKLEVLAQSDKLRKLASPAWDGVDVASKRAINLSLIGLAQYLYLHFSEFDIAEMARGAGTKPVADVNYGMLGEYQVIHNHIYEVVVKLRADKARLDKLRFRTDYLRRSVTYAGDAETVPEEASLEYIPPASQAAPTIDAEASPVPINVLRLNYWEIQSVLLKPPEKDPQKKDVLPPVVPGTSD